VPRREAGPWQRAATRPGSCKGRQRQKGEAMLRLPPAAITCLLMALSTQAFAIQELTPEPAQRYRVTAVSAGDSLNLRAQPDPSSKIFATLPPDATDIVAAGTRVETGGSVWWQVVTKEATGW